MTVGVVATGRGSRRGRGSQVHAAVAVVAAEIDDHRDRTRGDGGAHIGIVACRVHDDRGVRAVAVVVARADNHRADSGLVALRDLGKADAPLGDAQRAREACVGFEEERRRALDLRRIVARRLAHACGGR
jgi:hypothetical protein